ncbi:MAG: dUTP diphosphatase [Nanoarchaeota archaeon]
MKLKVKKLNELAIIPTYARVGDAGMDLCAIEDYSLKPGERRVFKTGLGMEIPNGYELQLRPRSGLASKHGISIVNSPGTIDSGYRGDIGIILINHGLDVFEVKHGDRIAQAVLNKFETAEFIEVDSLSESERGAGGFGHSGK